MRRSPVDSLWTAAIHRRFLGVPTMGEPFRQPQSGDESPNSKGFLAVGLVFSQTSATPDELTSWLSSLRLPALWTDNAWTVWLGLLVAIFLGLVVGKVTGAVLGRVARRLQSRGWLIWSHLLADLTGPGNLAILALGLSVGLAGLKMSDPLQVFWAKTLLLIYSIAAFWYAFNLVGIVDVVLQRTIAKTGSALDRQVVPLIRKTLRIFVVVIGAMFVVESVFDQNIGAWLAGLGIAGLAVSLAAQDSLKNLFGSITILFDRPFRVGDQIAFAGHEGAVEEIGFRSTKVRTGDGHMVTIPNASIVNESVRNISRRPYIKRSLSLALPSDTPSAKLQQAVETVRNILEEPGIREPIHPTIHGETLPPRAHFADYGASTLTISAAYWYAPPKYWDYMEHGQRVNLRILEEFERAGIQLVVPVPAVRNPGDARS